MNLRSLLKDKLVPSALEDKIDRIHKPVGTLGYDPWGYHTETAKVALTMVEKLYRYYFRVNASGV
ncbi:MAG: glycerol acyltransferase, partial [Gammaproteobacteria bacterium]|nr:glycerol acyltransferase [Gammaproteobacteria bacterium]